MTLTGSGGGGAAAAGAGALPLLLPFGAAAAGPLSISFDAGGMDFHEADEPIVPAAAPLIDVAS